MKKRNTPWEKYDEYEYYDNETSYLNTLVESCDLEWFGWQRIANQLNNKHNNDRSASACRHKWQSEFLQSE